MKLLNCAGDDSALYISELSIELSESFYSLMDQPTGSKVDRFFSPHNIEDFFNENCTWFRLNNTHSYLSLRGVFKKTNILTHTDTPNKPQLLYYSHLNALLSQQSIHISTARSSQTSSPTIGQTKIAQAKPRADKQELK